MGLRSMAVAKRDGRVREELESAATGERRRPGVVSQFLQLQLLQPVSACGSPAKTTTSTPFRWWRFQISRRRGLES